MKDEKQTTAEEQSKTSSAKKTGTGSGSAQKKSTGSAQKKPSGTAQKKQTEKSAPKKEREKEVAAAEETEAETAAQQPPVEEMDVPEEMTFEELWDRYVAAFDEAQDMKRRLYNVTAEYDNYRKRTKATKSQSYAEGRADVVKQLFPVADNLYRALATISDEQTAQGIMMIVKAFEKILQEEEITEINPVGEAFDPEKCEAIVAVDPEDGEESGIVREVYLRGYEQNGRILRYAQVIVTK